MSVIAHWQAIKDALDALDAEQAEAFSRCDNGVRATVVVNALSTNTTGAVKASRLEITNLRDLLDWAEARGKSVVGTRALLDRLQEGQ